MTDVFVCDGVRTPFGRYGGSLASIRTDDLAALPLRALMARNPGVDWGGLDDVVYGCANQAGEDNRNVARMALLLAGLPKEVSGATVNRLCGSSLEAVSVAARAIKSGEASLVIAGGVESMSRAPFVIGKAETAFSRAAKVEDTTMGWRFVNPAMKAKYGTDSMPETAENVAEEWRISREEQPRPDTTLEALAKLKPIVKPNGTVTAGNASGVNDGACALLLASEAAANQNGLTPLARVISTAAAGVLPRVMGIGPVPAVRKVLAKANLK